MKKLRLLILTLILTMFSCVIVFAANAVGKRYYYYLDPTSQVNYYFTYNDALKDGNSKYMLNMDITTKGLGKNYGSTYYMIDEYGCGSEENYLGQGSYKYTLAWFLSVKPTYVVFKRGGFADSSLPEYKYFWINHSAHTFQWTTTSTTHEGKCTGCGYKISSGSHTYGAWQLRENRNGGEVA